MTAPALRAWMRSRWGKLGIVLACLAALVAIPVGVAYAIGAPGSHSSTKECMTIAFDKCLTTPKAVIAELAAINLPDDAEIVEFTAKNFTGGLSAVVRVDEPVEAMLDTKYASDSQCSSKAMSGIDLDSRGLTEVSCSVCYLHQARYTAIVATDPEGQQWLLINSK